MRGSRLGVPRKNNGRVIFLEKVPATPPSLETTQPSAASESINFSGRANRSGWLGDPRKLKGGENCLTAALRALVQTNISLECNALNAHKKERLSWC